MQIALKRIRLRDTTKIAPNADARCTKVSGICELKSDQCEKSSNADPLLSNVLVRAWEILALVPFLEAFKAHYQRL